MSTAAACPQNLEALDQSSLGNRPASSRLSDLVGDALEQSEPNFEGRGLQLWEGDIDPDILPMTLDQKDLVLVEKLGGAILQIANANFFHT